MTDSKLLEIGKLAKCTVVVRRIDRLKLQAPGFNLVKQSLIRFASVSAVSSLGLLAPLQAWNAPGGYSPFVSLTFE